mgnify:CR=1 FL=1
MALALALESLCCAFGLQTLSEAGVYPPPMRPGFWSLAVAGTAIVGVPASTWACAPAPPPGSYVEIAEETALIVWNARTKQEHFIRRGAFRTEARDFGFLVPSPTKPELGAVPDKALTQFAPLLQPPLIHERSYEPSFMPLVLVPFVLSKGASMALASEVRVLDAKRVAGYDAVVLEADDPAALAAWLKEHGYDARPALQAWLAPYVEAHWKLTAFKIAGGERPVETDAIRMTFTTDRPFYPYREPADQREKRPDGEGFPSRLLRVFFVGSERMAGEVGKAPLQGKVVWAGALQAPPELPVTGPEHPWLTVFEDQSSPRPGTDELYFTPSPDQSEVRPPPYVVHVTTSIPIPLDVLGAAGVFFWWRRRKRA